MGVPDVGPPSAGSPWRRSPRRSVGELLTRREGYRSPMVDDVAVPGPVRRLHEELDEDGVTLAVGPEVAGIIGEELDYARRVPLFEGRRPLYGSIVADRFTPFVPSGEVDLMEVPGSLAAARLYADGRSSFLLRRPGSSSALACFDRPMQDEAEVVRFQKATGALVVQRTAVFGVVRLFAPERVVSWDGQSWRTRSTAVAMLPELRRAAPGLHEEVARGVLELAVHTLSPGRVGATLVVFDGEVDSSALDLPRSEPMPPLSVVNRRHFPALLALLQQHDLAAVVAGDGRIEATGVGLLATPWAEQAVGDGGMRHRSAQRYSFDQPRASVVVVSADGPVSVYRSGETVVAQPVPPLPAAPPRCS